MKDRGLSQRAVQDVAASVQRGDGAWVNHLNTSTASFQPAKSKTAPPVKTPRVGLGGPAGAPMAPPIPGRFSGKKMQHEILRDTPAEREMFVGGAPVVDREAEKDRLSRVMELGPKGVREMDAKLAAMKKEAQLKADRAKRADVREDMIDQIVAEVRDRLTFLEDMRRLGRGGEYEATIRGEVAARLKELERMGVPTR
ncbi:hypothetical protein HYH03_005240 [Edaphochlamys debaryana]|uniref:Uncharacterized protein n=1 Tax=Edaphochlamys debaryana TaxID=47281 RepID=A0A835YDJ7_9CHLO|nr:hypothetical protein HYH03_005240 [Edaphochlamys debaryana]|eukprot:KAG2496835.1 hypothetical protein HYH03_005240 [Edaphochlamys debaryana]